MRHLPVMRCFSKILIKVYKQTKIHLLARFDITMSIRCRCSGKIISKNPLSSGATGDIHLFYFKGWMNILLLHF